MTAAAAKKSARLAKNGSSVFSCKQSISGVVSSQSNIDLSEEESKGKQIPLNKKPGMNNNFIMKSQSSTKASVETSVDNAFTDGENTIVRNKGPMLADKQKKELLMKAMGSPPLKTAMK